MIAATHSGMDLASDSSVDDEPASILNELWPLNDIDPKKSKFPCCLVWTPLPIVSWLAPFFGRVGLCREDGSILEFSGGSLANVDDFAFGAVARYYQLDKRQCCLPPNLSRHVCKHHHKHHEFGTAISWDNALESSMRHYEKKSYNLFTCNCHSFAANCLNRLCYDGLMNWNVINVAALVLCKGKWVDGKSVLRSFLPFLAVICFGMYMVGWLFLITLLCFSLLLLAWFVLGTYFLRNILEC